MSWEVLLNIVLNTYDAILGDWLIFKIAVGVALGITAAPSLVRSMNVGRDGKSNRDGGEWVWELIFLIFIIVITTKGLHELHNFYS